MANPTAPASTPKPGHVYLKLAAGETYVLHNVPDVGTVHFTESAPVCPHPIPADFVRKLKLHEERLDDANKKSARDARTTRPSVTATRVVDGSRCSTSNSVPVTTMPARALIRTWAGRRTSGGCAQTR